MKTPYLIQRLQDPYRGHDTNPFSFGGGLVNGGIHPDFMKSIKGLFSFDYMGSAEFEFGALPRAFQSLMEMKRDKKLINFTVNDKIYVICSKDIKSQVSMWLITAAVNKHQATKESLGLKKSLDGDVKNKGWIKIESEGRCIEPFMFFTDWKMYGDTCKFFDL